MRAIVFLPLCLALAPPARAACEAPPLFAMDGPTCDPASMTRECGCSECLEWGATDGATWYEVTRCEVDTGRCLAVGDTRWRNRAGTTPTMWCFAWDAPFPAQGRFYDYTVRGCRDDGAGVTCSPTPSDPVRYAGAPYACFADGREVPCGVETATGAPAGDADADGVADSSDNCPSVDNALQRDADGDGTGDACDPTPFAADGAGEPPGEADPCAPTAADQDPDGDGVAEACDVCPSASDPSQSDVDDDALGDACDADDGRLALHLPDRGRVIWDAERGVVAWNVYRGDLATLVATGAYVQAPGSNPLAARACARTTPIWEDAFLPPPGATAFYLVGGAAGGPATGLGQDSAGTERSEAGGCP